jgi:hypothetical protein
LTYPRAVIRDTPACVNRRHHDCDEAVGLIELRRAPDQELAGEQRLAAARAAANPRRAARPEPLTPANGRPRVHCPGGAEGEGEGRSMKRRRMTSEDRPLESIASLRLKPKAA